MKALLVDGLNLVRRIFAAVPGQQDSEEHLQGSLRSSIASLQRALKTHLPTHCVAVFEHSGSNWRHDLFPDYKKNRQEMPSLLRNNMVQFESGFKKIGINCFTFPGYEADDVLATLAIKVAEHKGDAVLLTTDRNLCQLLNPKIRVFDHFGEQFLDAAFIEKRYGVRPDQLTTLYALTGNRALSIPGIKSIGVHTAARLIHDYGNLESILTAASDMPGKLSMKLVQGADSARLSCQLFTLKIGLNFGISLKQFRYPPDQNDLA